MHIINWIFFRLQVKCECWCSADVDEISEMLFTGRINFALSILCLNRSIGNVDNVCKITSVLCK